MNDYTVGKACFCYNSPFELYLTNKIHGETGSNLSTIQQMTTQSFPQTIPKSTSLKPIATEKTLKMAKQYREAPAYLINKTDHTEPKVQVRRLPLAKKVSPQSPNPVLTNRQERIQEIMKQSSVIHRRATLDPMRSLKSIPLINPEKVTRILVITYFRAGSSFFGDILQQNWKTFYHFEPLHSMTYDKRIDDEKMPEVFTLFNNVFSCNFTESKEYMQWVMKPKNQFLFAHNLFLWVTCHSNPKVCFNPSFVNAVCMRAPIHVMKVTRLHMRQLRSYLEQNLDMNIKVVHLTRDPRGIVSSRWSLDWCNGTNCSDSGVLCREMDEDIQIFNELQREQPLNFIKVRYEDLSTNPENETEKLFRFLNLPYSTSVKKFLKTHTVGRKSDAKNPYSTRRNSSSMVNSWRERFSYKQIINVQSHCENVLHKLNHSLITSPTQLPYPNGKPKPIVTVETIHHKTWRYNKNPLAKKYLANKGEFAPNSAHPSQVFLSNQTEIFRSNNTNIEVHKSYKFLDNFSVKNDSNKPSYNNAVI
ncbi:hypothetical protein TNCT_64781 [Trichonephila clavata]|uniref:Sulfotransferase domain-containing protein n=1 Tax=Trichonephila clavata TaxID=2740835 RepID=A0A8X6I0W5_TRICU|nr:hypothetical protein TNCT_64781 [Trichonephila clavata]